MNKNLKCDEFNEKYSIGTKGWLHMDNGDIKPTSTKSKAIVLNGNTPVIWVMGMSFCYLLDRFEPDFRANRGFD